MRPTLCAAVLFAGPALGQEVFTCKAEGDVKVPSPVTITLTHHSLRVEWMALPAPRAHVQGKPLLNCLRLLVPAGDDEGELTYLAHQHTTLGAGGGVYGASSETCAWLRIPAATLVFDALVAKARLSLRTPEWAGEVDYQCQSLLEDEDAVEQPAEP